MVYLKALKDDTVIAAEAHSDPVYIHKLPNGTIVRGSVVRAQGILSLDGSVIYQFDGAADLGIEGAPVAQIIYQPEYEELAAQLAGEGPDDPEDTEPEVPEGTDEETILTRAELTAKVAELEEELLAAKILLGVAE